MVIFMVGLPILHWISKYVWKKSKRGKATAAISVEEFDLITSFKLETNLIVVPFPCSGVRTPDQVGRPSSHQHWMFWDLNPQLALHRANCDSCISYSLLWLSKALLSFAEWTYQSQTQESREELLSHWKLLISSEIFSLHKRQFKTWAVIHIADYLYNKNITNNHDVKLWEFLRHKL